MPPRRSWRRRPPSIVEIVIALAGMTNPVRFALDVERDLLKVAHLERRVVKDVVVLGSERYFLPHRRQAGSDLPVAEGLDGHVCGRI